MRLTAASGFTLTELAVAVGLSSLVALGTATFLFDNIKASRKIQERGGAISLVAEIRNTLNSATTRRRVFEGVDSDGTAATAAEQRNCGDTLEFADDSTVLVDVFRPDGADMEIKLRDVGTVSSSSMLNKLKSSAGGDIRVMALKFMHVLPLASDADHDILSGELYATVANEEDYQNQNQTMRRVYVGRLMLKRERDTGFIVDCNVPSSAGNITGFCASQKGKVYDPVSGGCVYYQSIDTDGQINMCGPGYVFINIDGTAPACVRTSDPDNNPSTPPPSCPDGWASVGYEDGAAVCKRMGSLGTPDLPSAEAPAPSTGIDSSCQPYHVFYDKCREYATLSGGDLSRCGTQPADTGCTIVESQPPTTQVVHPSAAITPGAVGGCPCGSNGTVAVDDHCGFCNYDVTLGFNASANNYSIQQCAPDGRLVEVQNGLVNDNSGASPPTSGRCNSQLFRLDSGANIAKARNGRFDF